MRLLVRRTPSALSAHNLLGVLGRSKHYAALLEYLVQCSLTGKIPKEIELAVDVLNRGEDFDASADSRVRVYVHQLRKKLDSYYQTFEPDALFRVVIPRGQYDFRRAKSFQTPSEIRNNAGKYKSSLNIGLLLIAISLFAANLIYMMVSDVRVSRDSYEAAAEHPVWNSVLRDDSPILIVMGDYYIFGELNANGNVARMVREFNVNSRSDLEEMQFTDFERAENYLDLDLSYMPEGSAFALARIVPILQESGKNINITMMSDLTTPICAITILFISDTFLD